jgi:hypothetical protein
METEALVDRIVVVDLCLLPTAEACNDPLIGDAEARHAGNNILDWLTYLPGDCVNTMIEMGWDIST